MMLRSCLCLSMLLLTCYSTWWPTLRDSLPLVRHSAALYTSKRHLGTKAESGSAHMAEGRNNTVNKWAIANITNPWPCMTGDWVSAVARSEN
jgi:hypothetical protein